MDPALQEYLLNRHAEEEMEAIVKLTGKQRLPGEIRLVTRFGDVATCRIRVGAIPEIWADEAVESLKAPRFVGIEPSPPEEQETDKEENESVEAMTRTHNTGYSGKNVIIGMIDWGFDFTHPNFLHPDGTSRFLALWDQTAQPHHSAARYGYGQIFSRDDMNAALGSGNPFQTLGYHPGESDPEGTGAHGSHTAGIAAGSGAVGEPGIAPEAEIVAVQLSAGKIEGTATLGDSVRILEAIDFISEIAGNRPLVINMSIGKHGGSHKGNSLVEQAMDHFVRDKPGRAIVNSSGNYYSSCTHTSGRVIPGKEMNFQWIVDDNDLTPNELEIWYSKRDELLLDLSPPMKDAAPFSAALGKRTDIIIGNELVGRIYHRKHEPNTGENHINIFLYKKAPTGKWDIKLFGKDVADGRFHAWIERDIGCPGCQSRFNKDIADPSFSTGSICNGLYTIAVGAYEPADPNRKVTFFSSAGPTADGRKKPNLLAPGFRIRAARSATIGEQRSSGALTLKSGTSMAAPHVTGAIALLYEVSDSLIPIEITRNLLFNSLDETVGISDEEEYRYGFGYLNIPRLIQNAEYYFAKPIKHKDMAPVFDSLSNETHPESGNIENTHFDPAVEEMGEMPGNVQSVTAENFDPAAEEIEEDNWVEFIEQFNSEGLLSTPEHQLHFYPDEEDESQLMEIVGQWTSSHPSRFAHDFFPKLLTEYYGFSPEHHISPSFDSRTWAKNLFDAFSGWNEVNIDKRFLSLKKIFEHIVSPKQYLDKPLLPGDLLIIRSLGEGVGYQALLTTGKVWSREEALNHKLHLDQNKPGYFVEIVSVWPVKRSKSERFAKRIADKDHRLLPQYTIVRSVKYEFQTRKSYKRQPRIRKEDFYPFESDFRIEEETRYAAKGDPLGQAPNSINLDEVIRNLLSGITKEQWYKIARKIVNGEEKKRPCVETSYKVFLAAMLHLDVKLNLEFPKINLRFPRLLDVDDKPINPGLFIRLWYSNNSDNKWNQIDERFRGMGAPGALAYANLIQGEIMEYGEETNKSNTVDGWPQNLKPGTFLQLWRCKEEYEMVKYKKTEKKILGHSCIFKRYGQNGIYVFDQNNMDHFLSWGEWGLNYVIAALPGRIAQRALI